MKNNRTYTKWPRLLVLAVVLVLAGCTSKSPAPVSDRGGQYSATKGTYVVKAGDTVRSIAREFGMDYRELIAINNIESPDRIAPGRVLKVKPPVSVVAAGSSSAVAEPIASDLVVAKPLGNESLVEKRPLIGSSGTLKREPKAGKEPYSDQALAQAQSQPKTGESAPVLATTEAKSEVKNDEKPVEPVVGADEVNWVWPAGGKTIVRFGESGSKGVDIAGKAGDPIIASAGGNVSYCGEGLRGYGKLVIIKHNATYLSAYAHNQTILVKEGQSVSKGQKIADMGSSGTDKVKLHFEVRRNGKPVDPLKYLPQR